VRAAAALAAALSAACGSTSDPLASLALESRDGIAGAVGFTLDVPRGAERVDHGTVVGFESAQRHPREPQFPLVEVRVAARPMPASLDEVAAKAKGEVTRRDAIADGFLVSYWDGDMAFVTIVHKAGALAAMECRTLVFLDQKPSAAAMARLESICGSIAVH
jgi:hypothetical protein